MEEIELFDVRPVSFDSPAHFREYLASEFEPAEILHNLTIIGGLTELTREEFEAELENKAFRIERRQGALARVSHKTSDGQFESYLTFDPGPISVVLFYSNYRKTEELKQIQDFVTSAPRTYRLFLRPLLVKEILGKLLSVHPHLRILDFTASRNFNSPIPARMRPDVGRTVRYWGPDGREVLGELSDAYGVVPMKLRLDIPGVAKFSLDNSGSFTFFEGEISILLDIVGLTVERAVVDARVLKKAEFHLYPASIPGEDFSVPVSTPAEIALEVKLDAGQMVALMSRLEEEDFVPYNTSAEDGSLFFRSDILDLRSSQGFRLRADQNKLRVLPSTGDTLKPLLRFYELVLEQLDSRAELVA